MDIITILSTVSYIITGATLLLQVVAPLTETKKDNRLLEVLTKVLKTFSLNREKGELVIKLSGK